MLDKAHGAWATGGVLAWEADCLPLNNWMHCGPTE
jgi:hypothetical protein